jgi:HAD superfamily phosphatase (TIGR01668 family)
MKPTFKFKSVIDIPFSFPKENGIKLMIFDADSTLIVSKSSQIDKDILEKVLSFYASGIDIIIASNGKTARMAQVFAGHNIKSHGMSLKPFTFRLKKLIKGYKKDEIILIGDQFFTDILCAGFLGVRSVMVEPYGGDKGIIMKLKRGVERFVLAKTEKW